ncbi:MAG: type 1 glutamine amidotransferase [Fibrobacterales bacterium]
MKSLHYIQHVPFEDPGYILEWAEEHSFDISSTKLYDGERLPDLLETDLLVIMGGPMGIYDYEEYPWLKAEKEFLEREIDQGTKMIGICLGAQLIADVLGAKVAPGPQKEIGWFQIERLMGAKTHPYFADVPDSMVAMHWHGDQFEIPKNAISLFSSEGCDTQGFIYNDQVIGFQFHIESTGKSLDNLITHCGDELVDGIFIQTESAIRESALHHMQKANSILSTVCRRFLNL